MSLLLLFKRWLTGGEPIPYLSATVHLTNYLTAVVKLNYMLSVTMEGSPMPDIIGIYQGDTVDLALTISQRVWNGTAYVTSAFDLTGATLVSTVGGSPGWSGTPTVVSAVAGTITIQIPAVTTNQMAPGSFPADVQVTKAGSVKTATEFTLLVTEDVSV